LVLIVVVVAVVVVLVLEQVGTCGKLSGQALLKDLQGDSFRLSPHSAMKMFTLTLDALVLFKNYYH
jgi:hypothetical protein